MVKLKKPETFEEWFKSNKAALAEGFAEDNDTFKQYCRDKYYELTDIEETTDKPKYSDEPVQAGAQAIGNYLFGKKKK